MIGACKYCGQTAMVDAETEAEAVYQATMACDCVGAVQYREMQTKAGEAIAEMNELYLAEKVPERIIELMQQNIQEMAEYNLTRAQFILPNGKKLTVTRKGQGFTVETQKADKKKVDV